MGKTREVAEIAKMVMKKFKEEVEKKGLSLSVTENEAAAGKKNTASVSLFMEAYGLGVEEELSTVATKYWGPENGTMNKEKLG